MCVKWCISGSATENSILLSVLLRLNIIFNQSINHNQISQIEKTSFMCRVVTRKHNFVLASTKRESWWDKCCKPEIAELKSYIMIIIIIDQYSAWGYEGHFNMLVIRSCLHANQCQRLLVRPIRRCGQITPRWNIVFFLNCFKGLYTVYIIMNL